MAAYPTQLNQLLTYLDEMQALDVTVLYVKNQTTVTDYMIIASGRSSRHVSSIATTIMEKMKAAGVAALGSHGLENADWVIVDLGDYVVHIMQPDSRAFYNLEGLWQTE